MRKAQIKDFYDLDAWKKGHELALTIYQVSKTFPSGEQFGLTSQLQRAASSVTANIAEGFGRYHFKDKARFYRQSRGSLAEVLNFLMLARDLRYLSEESYHHLHTQIDEIRRLTHGLIRSIQQQQ